MANITRETPSVRTLVSRAAAAAAAALALAACSDKNADVLIPNPPANAAFMQRYVALGNSITAGYQSGGINDSTQRESYARLVALQAGTDYRYVSIPAPCAPPLAALTGERVNAPGACPGVVPPTAILNNVAVPGATSADGVTPFTASYSALTSFILGGKSQAKRALDADPTFVSDWLGNNDVLDAAVKGSPVAVAGLTAGATATAAFNTNYDQTLDTLRRQNGLRGALISVVDVKNIPVLFSPAVFANPAFKAAFDQYVGKTVTILPNCTGSTSLVSFAIVTFFRSRPAAEPAVIGCAKGSVPGNPVVGDYFILDEAEQNTISGRVAEYNQHIKAKADELGWAYVDVNPALTALKQSGAVPPFPSLGTPATPWGDYFSVDGIHPSGKAHRVIANLVIDGINAKYGSSIPKVTP